MTTFILRESRRSKLPNAIALTGIGLALLIWIVYAVLTGLITIDSGRGGRYSLTIEFAMLALLDILLLIAAYAAVKGVIYPEKYLTIDASGLTPVNRQSYQWSDIKAIEIGHLELAPQVEVDGLAIFPKLMDPSIPKRPDGGDMPGFIAPVTEIDLTPEQRQQLDSHLTQMAQTHGFGFRGSMIQEAEKVNQGNRFSMIALIILILFACLFVGAMIWYAGVA